MQLFKRGGRHIVVEVEVEWVNEGDPSLFTHINEHMYELNDNVHSCLSKSSKFCNSLDISYVPSTLVDEVII